VLEQTVEEYKDKNVEVRSVHGMEPVGNGYLHGG